MIDLTNVTNSQIAYIIDEYCHVQKYRDLLKRRYIDGIVYETLVQDTQFALQNANDIANNASQSMYLISQLKTATA